MSARKLVVIAGGTGTGCYSDGVPCPWVRTSHFGTLWFCHLFRTEFVLKDEAGITGGPGTLQRWPECIEAEKAASSSTSAP